MQLVFDIETDGLNATKILCMAAKNLETNEVHRYSPSNMDAGYSLINEADLLVGHNVLGFDIPVLKRLTNIEFKNKQIIDTVVLSRLSEPTRHKHSLKAWGASLDFLKGAVPSQDFFTEYTPELLDYCVNDVELNTLLYSHLQGLLEKFNPESIWIEHEVAKILIDLETTGFLLDVRYADELLAFLNNRQKNIIESVHKVFKPKLIKIKEVLPKKKLDGSLSKQGLSSSEYESQLLLPPTDMFKPFDRMKLQEFNLGSKIQISKYLQDFGWCPEQFTKTGLPKLGEQILATVKNIPEAQLIATYLMLTQRISQITSWFKYVDRGGRVHGHVVSNGTVTQRMTHYKPNMAQVTSSKKPYGTNCRVCWTVPTGYKLVGIDASQLQLRMLAHYLNDKEFINEILTGDIHERNRKLAGLESRDQAKTFVYAFLFGARDTKLGAVVGGDTSDGCRLRRQFLANIPSLKNLGNRIERVARTRGWFKGLDGRIVSIRSVDKALNALLMAAEAVVMKRAVIFFSESLHELDLDARIVAIVHDEWQVEAHASIAEQVGLLGISSMQKAGDILGLNCPLDGEYNIGDNWSETH